LGDRSALDQRLTAHILAAACARPLPFQCAKIKKYALPFFDHSDR
jgi:hypothetical protein